MNTLLQDLRYGIRMLLKNPGFAFVAVIALALGIGANAAIFSVVNAVLLRSLPYDDPERLIVVKENKPPQFPEFSVSPGNFLDWQKQNTVFEKLAAIRGYSYNLVDKGEPERLRGARISAGLFEMLGVKPARGRSFLAEEDQPGHETVAILSHALWQRRFGADEKIIGQAITMNATSYTVIGIMPPTFQFPDRETELWTPVAFDAQQAQQHGAHYISVVGRLKRGVSLQQASTEMSAIAGRLAQSYPDSNAGWGVTLFPMQEYEAREIKPALLVLLGAVALVLLIACANVANLLLARATARQREIAIRTALGASRWRVIRQLLTESILLAIVGGGVGLLLAVWGVDLLLALAPPDLPRGQGSALDARVLGFTILITLLTGVVFGLAPALQSSRPNLNETLKEGGRGTTGGHHRVRSSLVITEVALALVLLIGAGLLIRSFYRLQQVNPGFNPKNALTVSVSLPAKKYAEDDQQAAFFSQLIERVSALPGVVAVGATQSLPIQGDYVLGFNIQGRPPDAPGEEPSTNYYAVNSEYFKAMGIPLLRGRLFTEQDKKDAPRVAVINETMAKKFFPGEDPIGKGINVTNGPERFREIVGIVGDVKQYGLDQPTTAQTYEPYLQAPFSAMTLIVRTEGNPTALNAGVRGQVLSIDKDQPVSRIRTLEEVISESVAKQRFSMLLLGVFAVVALVLAAVGLYGVMSYAVTQRTHEIGIRMALGAQQKDVLRLVVGHGMILAMVGVGIGLLASFALTRVMTTLLFGVGATDPLTFLVIPALLTIVALGASFFPARRAMKVDPMIALRYE
ncbi:MAG TPA: ABC transporter permease [Pyrinomonadaceae bacterium]|jgi:putative ABC transport system permease protein|nr:ABC transporter permease [Pyrinomonadaceae bacterium]